jgi:hypothetical protein
MYSKREVTKIEDRLPALSGIARTFQTVLKGRYFAGIWEENLSFFKGLCWFTLSVGFPDAVERMKLGIARAYVAPTWSWVSCPALIQHHSWNWDSATPLVDIHEVVCTPASLKSFSNGPKS